jgi:membrane dipeptidase
MTTRRELLKTSLASAATLIYPPLISKESFRLFNNSSQEYSKQAIKLVEECLVIDMLNQFKGYLKTPAAQLTNWLTKPGAFTEADARKYVESGINVFALGRGAMTYEEGIRFYADWNGFIAGYSQWLMRIDSIQSLERIKTSGKIGILLSFQTSNHFRSPDDVDTFFGLGQRISQLTYSQANLIGSGFFEERDGGLTDFGVSIVERMNKVGMAIDLSHCGDQTTLGALELSKKPLLFTHAACRSLVPGSIRCKTDEMIRKLAAKGGVMGIPFIRFQIRDKEPVTIEHLLDHFKYVVKLVGIEHVGMGSDFALDTDDEYIEESKELAARVQAMDKRNRYGMHLSEKGLVGIEGVNHAKRVYDLTEGLIRRKYSDDQIRLILGGNCKRVLSSIWPV